MAPAGGVGDRVLAAPAAFEGFKLMRRQLGGFDAMVLESAAWRRGHQVAPVDRFLSYLRCYRGRHARIAGPADMHHGPSGI